MNLKKKLHYTRARIHIFEGQSVFNSCAVGKFLGKLTTLKSA